MFRISGKWFCNNVRRILVKEVKSMQGREIMILRSSIASLKQYNQYLLKRNEVLESLVKKYKKFLEDLQK